VRVGVEEGVGVADGGTVSVDVRVRVCACVAVVV
jgi:hypothetical protein